MWLCVFKYLFSITKYDLIVCNMIFNYPQQQQTMKKKFKKKKKNNNSNNNKIHNNVTNFPIYKSEKENILEIFKKI